MVRLPRVMLWLQAQCQTESQKLTDLEGFIGFYSTASNAL
jgi:hypothetical protein